MALSLFLLAIGAAGVALVIWQPSSNDRNDPNAAFYSYGLWVDLRLLVGALLIFALGLAGLSDSFGFGAGWFEWFPIPLGLILASFGLLILRSRKFNSYVWKVIPVGSSHVKDRAWMGWGLIIIGVTLFFVWVALVWPYPYWVDRLRF